MLATDAIVQQLRRDATWASQRAYCVYSKFPVGAAVLTPGDEIFRGCNVENASFGLTICAERSAVFQAVAAGHTQLRAVVVVTPTELVTPPCGACRQVISEFGTDVDVFSFARNGRSEHYKLADLLPAAFGPQNLNPDCDSG